VISTSDCLKYQQYVNKTEVICDNGNSGAGLLAQRAGCSNPRAAEREVMLSARLVQLIEGHSEELSRRLVKAIKTNPEMRELAARPDGELMEWCGEILNNLGFLLSAPKDEVVHQRFQVLGRARFEDKIPLHETVLRFHLLKDKIIGFVHEQGFPMSAVQLYSEEELEHRIGRFFDACVYNVVRGYEEAQRVARRLAS
jgi:hypothetical protein